MLLKCLVVVPQRLTFVPVSAQDDFPGADELDMDDEEEDEEDAPELVTAEEARPNKRQRKD